MSGYNSYEKSPTRLGLGFCRAHSQESQPTDRPQSLRIFSQIRASLNDPKRRWLNAGVLQWCSGGFGGCSYIFGLLLSIVVHSRHMSHLSLIELVVGGLNSVSPHDLHASLLVLSHFSHVDLRLLRPPIHKSPGNVLLKLQPYIVLTTHSFREYIRVI